MSVEGRIRKASERGHLSWNLKAKFGGGTLFYDDSSCKIRSQSTTLNL